MLTKIISVITTIMLINLNSYSQSCQDTLNSCDTAYRTQKILIDDQKQQINNYFKKDGLQHQVIDDQQKKLDSPFRDPIKMIGLGIIGTVVVEVLLGVFKK